jgi:hypothetical protein
VLERTGVVLKGLVARTEDGLRYCIDCLQRCFMQVPGCVAINFNSTRGSCTYLRLPIALLAERPGVVAAVDSAHVPSPLRSLSSVLR